MIDPRHYLNPGAVLVRTEPLGDGWDRIRVDGFAMFEGGIIEVVVRPVDGFAPAIHADVEALNEAFEVERDGARERPFETPLEDVLLRRDSTLTDPGGASRVIASVRHENEQPSVKVEAWKQAKEHRR